MILVLAIILFIIFLIYSIRPSKCEEYTLEGLKLSWSNKASIEGIVTKWIVTLKDSSGNVIHTYENSDAGNLKDFTDVTMNIVDKKEFDDKIIGNNTLELYYNDVKPDTKLYTKTVTFTQDDFGMSLDMSNLEEIVPNTDCVGKYIKLKRNKTTEGAERFACGPQDDSDRHYCQFWKHKIETEKGGTGKACSRANNFVIKTQWPTETTASKRIGTSFQNDPNPNTDENVLNNPQYYKKIWDSAPPPPAQPTYTYELIMNKKNTSLGIHVEYIKLDGVLATKAQTTIHKNPNRNNKPDNIFSVGSGTENYAAWNSNGHNVGDKIFTIISNKKVDKIDIVYTRPRYAPGWIIKENGVTKITETSNRGNNTDPRPVVYTYDIKNGKSTPSTIPHQIPRAADGGWCGHANSVHQDVPGCGRICSDVNAVGSKNKNTWGSWDKYPGSVDCPAAKLDEVYQFLNGKRSLRVGKVSGTSVPAVDLTGGFKWYYYEGSYFSVPSSFNNKEPTAEGTGIKDFSSKHKATGGYLPNNGSKSNYAVRWQGRFVPKKTGTHKFWTESDDMSYLYVGYKEVVDNGGLHGKIKKDGTFNMTKGKEYLIEIFFSEKGGGDEMKVWFKGPGMSSAIHDFSGYMVNDTKICSSEMFGGRKNKGVTDYKHCMECAHKWEPGTHKRSINCENIWLDD